MAAVGGQLRQVGIPLGGGARRGCGVSRQTSCRRQVKRSAQWLEPSSAGGAGLNKPKGESTHWFTTLLLTGGRCMAEAEVVGLCVRVRSVQRVINGCSSIYGWSR